MDDLEKFCEFVYGDLTGYVYSPVKRPDSWDSNFFRWPEQKQELIDHVRVTSKEEQANVYMAPALFKEKRADKASVKYSQVAWVEFDGKEKIDFLNVPRPDAIVQSSTSTHVHCYWKIPTTNVQALEDINLRLTYYLQADSSGWDANQILRPPTSTNWKHNLPVVLAHYEPVGHEPSSFDVAPKVVRTSVDLQEADLQNPRKLLLTLPFGKDLTDMITKEMPPPTTRSSFLFKLANELAEFGCDINQIASLLMYADERVGKYKGRRDRLERIVQIAGLAIHKHGLENQLTLYSLKDILNYTENLDWILPGWLHMSGLMILSGAPGVGKTQAALDLATNVIVGRQWLHKGTMKTGLKSLFLSLEMDKVELKYIISHQAKEWPDNFDHSRFAVNDVVGSLKQYEDIIADYKPNIVIIDSLSELFEDEMGAPEAKKMMRWLNRLRRTYRCGIILIHHNRKATEGNKKPKGLSDLYGSFMFGKDSETVITLYEERNKLEMGVLKARYGKKEWFEIERSENLTFTRKAATPTTNPLIGNAGGVGGIALDFK